MKKILFTTFTAICISAIIPCKTYALDITLGATTWYALSEQNYTQDKKRSPGVINNSIAKSDPAFLYGPTLAVRFTNDFNITFVYLYGHFETEKDQGGGRKSKTKFSRSDSDIALNYRLGDYFKVFAGMKYLSYGITPARTDSVTFEISKNVDMHTSYGPGLGLSATVPVIGNLFALGTVSGLYLWGSHGADITDMTVGTPPNYQQRSVNLKYNEYGINTTVSLAYYIAPASTVISLGGRFQYLKADYTKNSIYLKSIEFTSYGVTLTATYTFSI
ncbi:MAG: hypothetical protein FWF73_03835 [Spirochaetes bacterium]|nr:hypothetical protein [Spirochaetota bacterium]